MLEKLISRFRIPIAIYFWKFIGYNVKYYQAFASGMIIKRKINNLISSDQ